MAVRECVEITGAAPEVEQLEIRNNVFVSEAGLDLIRVGSTTALPASWKIAGNWRQVRRPSARAETSIIPV